MEYAKLQRYAIRVLPSPLWHFALWLWVYWPAIVVWVSAGLLGFFVFKLGGWWCGAAAALIALLVIPRACLLLAYIVHTVDKALSRRREAQARRCELVNHKAPWHRGGGSSL